MIPMRTDADLALVFAELRNPTATPKNSDEFCNRILTEAVNSATPAQKQQPRGPRAAELVEEAQNASNSPEAPNFGSVMWIKVRFHWEDTVITRFKLAMD